MRFRNCSPSSYERPGGYFFRLTLLTLGRLRRRGGLLALLAALCLLLPWGAGLAAESALGGGAAFSGITLAVTSPEGGGTPELLADYLGGMEDVGRYCRVLPMERGEALEELAAGRVTAVLALPEDFVSGVQSGENPAVEVIVDSGRPLESLLTLWVGQSAVDLLSAVQAGVYAVLDCYDQAPPPGLSREEAVLAINLRYVSWTLNRGELFEERALLPTGVLPIALHYGLSLLGFLVLSMAPVFAWNFQGAWLALQRRCRRVGRSPLNGYCASLLACALPASLAVFLALAALFHAPALPALGAALGWGCFFAVWAGLWGLTARGAAGCGGASFLAALAALALAGGVVPPVLLPERIRALSALSPVTWLRSGAALALGHGPEVSALLPLAATAALGILGGALYCRRCAGEETRV